MDEPGRIHTIPLGDLREHVSLPTCWCHPTQDADEPGLWVHHAMDLREEYEEQRRRPS